MDLKLQDFGEAEVVSYSDVFDPNHDHACYACNP